ncbi:MAG: excinuclease ABC subunit C, partial [Candidatus Liptonbacteria bacterium]
AMLGEVLGRRMNNDWPLPDLILVDGGVGQVGAARKILLRTGKRIPLIGIAKGPRRKRNDVVGEIPAWTDLETLVKVRDEAHRFAIKYHKLVRARNFLGN